MDGHTKKGAARPVESAVGAARRCSAHAAAICCRWNRTTYLPVIVAQSINDLDHLLLAIREDGKRDLGCGSGKVTNQQATPSMPVHTICLHLILSPTCTNLALKQAGLCGDWGKARANKESLALNRRLEVET